MTIHEYQRNDERKSEESNTGLRKIYPTEITSYLDQEWSEQVQVTLAPVGGHLTVPKGWHGEGKWGDAIVLFGNVLTAPIAGTELAPDVFTDWLMQKGFSFENNRHPLSYREAAELLQSDAVHEDGAPIFRAVRDHSVPIILESYHGSLAPEMQRLTQIGNMDQPPEDIKEEYRKIVNNLLRPFISVGATRAKERMGLRRDVNKLRRIDDCAAAYTTIAADIAIDTVKNIPPPDIEEVDVSVATTQAIVVSICLAEKRGVPLLFRIGAPSFGLGNEQTGLNYMMNTQAEMRKFGDLTSGDFGNIMSEGLEKYQQPYVGIYGNGKLSNKTRFYLNGGGPIQTIMSMQYQEKKKPYDGIIDVLRASRIDNGPSMWGVIFEGKQIPKL